MSNPNQIYLAFYKGRKKVTNLQTAMFYSADWLIRTATRGEFSHVEIAMANNDGAFDCYSSSAQDGGVRRKTMTLGKRWELVPINTDKQTILDYYEKTKHQKYDVFGAVASTIPFVQFKDKQFCSEWVYNAITGTNNGWQFNPVRLYLIATDIGFSNKDGYYTADKVNNLNQNTI